MKLTIKLIFGEVSSISGLIYKHSNLKIDTEDSVYLNLETKKNKKKIFTY